MIRNVILDWSGTLVDDLPAVWRATNYVLTQAQREKLTLDQFRAEFCLPFTRFYNRHVPHIPLAQLEVWFHSSFREMQGSVCALPHARRFLEFCRAHNLRTFLLSAVHRDHFARQSDATGFAPFFEDSYIEVRDKRAKIREILSEKNLKADETLFVGDMQHDIETARHGGIHSCAVLTGYNTLNQLRAAAPELIVEHLGELQNWFEQNGLSAAGPSPASRQRRSGPKTPAGRLASRTLPFACAETPVATVGALIFNDPGDILLVRTQKWSDLWGIPGGKIKLGETALEALRREIREETNLAITDIDLALIQDCIHPKEFYRKAHFILLNYTCRTAGKAAVKLNEEAREFRWVAPESALELPLNEPTRTLLLAVLFKGKRKSRKKGI